MTSQNSGSFKYITSNRLPAKESKSLIWWLAYVCFAYHYKVIVCGFFGKDLGYDWLCKTVVHGVTTNHWFEQLIYAPILWLAFYKIINIVFGPGENEILGKKVRRLKTVAYFLLAMYIYGIGIHFINTVEIYARTELNIESGALYDQIYWIDEQFSHWVQFFFFFSLFAWLIIYDRLDRVHGGYAAIFTGLLHGLERAIGVIEGDSPFVALLLGAVILVACFIRWQNHGRNFNRVWKDFFFRHGLSFGLSMPIALYVYQFVFNGFIQPSTMGESAWLVIVFVAVFTGIGFSIAILFDRMLGEKKV